jgi:hypothetical protein
MSRFAVVALIAKGEYLPFFLPEHGERDGVSGNSGAWNFTF